MFIIIIINIYVYNNIYVCMYVSLSIESIFLLKNRPNKNFHFQGIPK